LYVVTLITVVIVHYNTLAEIGTGISRYHLM